MGWASWELYTFLHQLVGLGSAVTPPVDPRGSGAKPRPPGAFKTFCRLTKSLLVYIFSNFSMHGNGSSLQLQSAEIFMGVRGVEDPITKFLGLRTPMGSVIMLNATQRFVLRVVILC